MMIKNVADVDLLLASSKQDELADARKCVNKS